ncbi:peptidoglycan-binding domain-containing protein [Limnospira platensis CENA597]|uniref:peptidoglycan-binding domain-containing protein n=1 Tax=Limnospira platensis TaxID=118562 RepID=UPI003DA13EC1
MGIKTAIIAGLMALAIPGFTGPAIATSGTTSAIAESEVERLLNLTQDRRRFSDNQSPFSEPFYQPREEIREETTFAEPFYQPREEIREETTFAEPFHQPHEEIREETTFAEPFYQPEENQIRPREMTLARGTQGVQVAGLQQRLEVHGFSVGRVDSLFGPRTERALINFQLSKGLRPTGVVDRSTWQALSKDPHQQTIAETLIKQGDRGSKVKTLQTRLELTGHDPGPVDGIFGPKTLAAVSDFQLAMGLESTGVVDDKTWKVLGDRSN